MSEQLRTAARAIVIYQDSLLVMRRTKPDKQYMVTPGGRLEPGEESEAALYREIAEETMIEIANPRLVFIEEPNDKRWGTQHFYLCDYASGKPQLHPDSEEMQDNLRGVNLYEPLWQPLSSLPDQAYPFRSARLLDEIKDALVVGFPNQPKQWTLDPPVVE